jgi:hypothetical protein
MNSTHFKHLWALGLLLSFTAHAGIYYSGTLGGGTIPDGDVSGRQNSYTFDGILDSEISGVTITFDVSGGYNGHLYAYLQHGTGIAFLLNRVGVGSSDPFGASGSGLSGLVLSSSAGNNIHFNLGSGTTGTFAPDGRSIDPLSPASAFDETPSGNALSTFNGASANGNWTLFFSDVVTGGGTPALTSWSLEISTVPEPVNVALGAFGLGAAGVGLGRRVYARFTTRNQPGCHWRKSPGF